MATPGWYGKLPMLGDFAHRRLPTSFIATCDAWLAKGVSASRDALGAAWLDTYLTAPIWCFVWSPRVVDGQWWSGVLMPSVDSVGRYFPLVIAFNHAQLPVEPRLLAEWARWYDGAATCALQTLLNGASLDQFESRLRDAGTPAEWPGESTAPPHSSDDEIQRVPSLGQERQDAAIAALLTLQQCPHGRTAWWPHANGGTSGAVTVVQGLPTADRFVELFWGVLHAP